MRYRYRSKNVYFPDHHARSLAHSLTYQSKSAALGSRHIRFERSFVCSFSVHTSVCLLCDIMYINMKVRHLFNGKWRGSDILRVVVSFHVFNNDCDRTAAVVYIFSIFVYNLNACISAFFPL